MIVVGPFRNQLQPPPSHQPNHRSLTSDLPWNSATGRTAEYRFNPSLPTRLVGITGSVSPQQKPRNPIETKCQFNPKPHRLEPKEGWTRQLTSNLHTSLPLVDTLQQTQTLAPSNHHRLSIINKQHSLSAVTRSCVLLLVSLINRVHCQLAGCLCVPYTALASWAMPAYYQHSVSSCHWLQTTGGAADVFYRHWFRSNNVHISANNGSPKKQKGNE